MSECELQWILSSHARTPGHLNFMLHTCRTHVCEFVIIQVHPHPQVLHANRILISFKGFFFRAKFPHLKVFDSMYDHEKAKKHCENEKQSFFG